MEKTVSVRLRMAYDQFVKGAKESADALGGIGKKSKESTDQATKNWSNLQRSAADMGSSLTSKVTLPIVAAGTAMVVMATNFDNTFAQMRQTAGVAESEVEGLKDSVLELSGATGRGPQELAESLLLIRSSGFAGAAALDVLEMAAKGAAAGMGETRELANALTNVIAGYGQENITAAQAMDVLTASVQEGKAEAAEMAPQFGRLVPLASQLDVQFHDVAGALAFMTRQTGDAAQSSTALQGILSKLFKPSLQGKEALEGIGMSVRDLHQQLGQDGLLKTLVSLRDELGMEQFGLLFDDVQALNGAIQLTGSGMKEAEAVIAAVTDSAGKADEAFGKWAESMGAKNSIAFAKLQAGAIQLGDQLAPTVAEIISFLGELVSIVADLPEPMQKAIIAFAALAAAAGPMLTVSSNMIRVVTNMTGVFGKFGASTAGLGPGIAATAAGFSILAPLMIGAGLALQHYVDQKAEAKRRTDGFTEALKREAVGIEGESEAFATAELAVGDLGTQLRESEADFGVLTDAVKKSRDELDLLHRDRGNMEMFSHDIDTLADSGSALGEELRRLRDDSDMGLSGVSNLVDRLNDLNDDLRNSATEMENAEAATSDLGGEQKVTAEQVQILNEALQTQVDALKASYDPFFGLQDALTGVRDAQAGWEQSMADVMTAQADLDKAIKDHGAGSAEAAEAARGLAEAEAGVEDAQWAASEAAVNLVSAGEVLRSKLEEQGLSADAVQQQLYDYAIQMGFSHEQAMIMAGGIGTVTGKLEDIPPLTVPQVRVAGVEESIRDIDTIQARVNAMEGRDVHIRIVGTSVGVSIPHGGLRAEGGPVKKGVGYTVGEKGRELFVPDKDGHIVPNHQLTGSMLSQSSFMGQSAGPATNVYVDMRGAIVASRADAQRWVAEAWNGAASRNLVSVRGRPL